MSLLCFYKCIDFGLKTKMSITTYPIGSGIPRVNALTPQQEYTGPRRRLTAEKMWKGSGNQSDMGCLRNTELHFSLEFIPTKAYLERIGSPQYFFRPQSLHLKPAQTASNWFMASRFISQDSGFKVPGACAFHSYAGSCKVCRSDIGNLGVEDNDLEVNTWAEGSLQTGKKNRILVEVLPEIGSWFLCMNQPDLFPFLDEVGEDTQERSIFHIEILDIRRPYPD